MAKDAPKVVKSVQRTIEVLEYFGPDRCSGTASEIARALSYPISSTAELLWSMVELGYLTFEQETKRFHPTARLPLLGYWQLPNYFKNGPLLSAMEDLANSTRAIVALAVREGLTVRYLHVIRRDGPVRSELHRGTGRCMLHSAVGRLLLSRMPNALIPKVIHRINAEVASEWRVSPASFQAELEAIRRQGYSVTVDHITPNVGTVAVALPRTDDGQELVLSVSAVAETIKAQEAFFVAELLATSQAFQTPAYALAS